MTARARPGRPAPSRPGGNRARRAAEARRRERRNRWIGGAVVGVFVAAAAVGGYVLQSHRSKLSQPGRAVVAPAHALGPAGSEVLGAASAPVLVEEYADFQCPVCGAFEKQTGPTIRALIEQGKIRYAFHHFAFLGAESAAEANAAECAGDAGKFWPVHDLLFASQQRENSGYWTTARLSAAVESAGATGPQVAGCLANGTYRPWLQKVTDEGSQRGVNGTPTVYVNGKKVSDLTPNSLLAAITAAAASH
jgi:protein-disulfide isomerase